MKGKEFVDLFYPFFPDTMNFKIFSKTKGTQIFCSSQLKSFSLTSTCSLPPTYSLHNCSLSSPFLQNRFFSVKVNATKFNGNNSKHFKKSFPNSLVAFPSFTCTNSSSLAFFSSSSLKEDAKKKKKEGGEKEKKKRNKHNKQQNQKKKEGEEEEATSSAQATQATQTEEGKGGEVKGEQVGREKEEEERRGRKLNKRLIFPVLSAMKRKELIRTAQQLGYLIIKRDKKYNTKPNKGHKFLITQAKRFSFPFPLLSFPFPFLSFSFNLLPFFSFSPK